MYEYVCEGGNIEGAVQMKVNLSINHDYDDFFSIFYITEIRLNENFDYKQNINYKQDN